MTKILEDEDLRPVSGGGDCLHVGKMRKPEDCTGGGVGSGESGTCEEPGLAPAGDDSEVQCP